MSYRKILLEHRGDVAVVTLNAPEKRNALDLEMVQDLHAALDELAALDSLKALVIRGAGEKAFAAGADIAELERRDGKAALRAINSGIFKRIEDFPVPSIAAITGYALGGGCELAIACDLRVAGRSAKLGQPEVSLGIIPGAGGCYRLPRLIGLGRARELVYTGRAIDAEEALRIGLVNHVVDDAKVLDRALELAAEIAKNGPLAVRAAKATINALARPNEGMALAFESTAQAMLFDSEDKHARMRAFLARGKEKK
jgi:enoyl-CoA hydratase